MIDFGSVPLWIYALAGFLWLLTLAAIWHAWSHSFPNENERLIWMAVCVFFPVLGLLAYILFGLRRARKNSIRR